MPGGDDVWFSHRGVWGGERGTSVVGLDRHMTICHKALPRRRQTSPSLFLLSRHVSFSDVSVGPSAPFRQRDRHPRKGSLRQACSRALTGVDFTGKKWRSAAATSSRKRGWTVAPSSSPTGPA